MGALSPADPLHGLITRMLALRADSHLDVFGLNSVDHAVYLYVDRTTGQRVVGKFYGRKWIEEDPAGGGSLRSILVRQECAHLDYLRGLGFTGRPYIVPRPLAVVDEIDWLLLEEYVEGINLHQAIRKCVREGYPHLLLRSLEATARFLFALHTSPRSELLRPPRDPSPYHSRLVRQLRELDILQDDGALDRHLALTALWERRGDAAVPIHGDATPEHFLWNEGEERLGVIDLEALRHGDPAEDLGYLAAELKHFFWVYTDDRWAAEPYIAHFYAAYGSDYALTRRAKVFMGLAELRIARNFWLPLDYRRQLAAEAERCLSS